LCVFPWWTTHATTRLLQVSSFCKPCRRKVNWTINPALKNYKNIWIVPEDVWSKRDNEITRQSGEFETESKVVAHPFSSPRGIALSSNKPMWRPRYHNYERAIAVFCLPRDRNDEPHKMCAISWCCRYWRRTWWSITIICSCDNIHDQERLFCLQRSCYGNLSLVCFKLRDQHTAIHACKHILTDWRSGWYCTSALFLLQYHSSWRIKSLPKRTSSETFSLKPLMACFGKRRHKVFS
jgi:hypothetical protein